MAVSPETAALVALLQAGDKPPHVYSDLVESAGEARAVLEAEQGLLAGQLIEVAAGEAEVWQQAGIRVVTVLDPDYPDNLRAVHDRPPLIFIAGQMIVADSRSVAVIGSRRASDEGVGAARALAKHLVQAGFTVISGLAVGIATAAHTAPLVAGGRTLAVIGTGLRRFYPAENADLQREIARRFAVVSQFWPDASPPRQSFPKRNALMSGLALATVVVEAHERSGARTQARLALAHGRPLLLREAVLKQEWARALANRPGVHVVSSPDEVVDVVERLSSTTSPVN